MSLLQKALKLQKGRNPNKQKHVYGLEDYKLAMGWVKGNVSLNTLAKVLGHKPNTASSLYYVAYALRWGIENGKLKVKKI